MSVYSGFATRQQQTKYNTLLETLVIALKKRLIKFYQKEECDEGKFKVLIKKVYKKMYLLEKGKFMVPKYTSCFTDLIEHLNINIDFDSLSDASSRISASFSLHGGGGNEQQQHIFKSRNILQTKRNFLSTKVKQHEMDSAFSLKNKINTFGIQNQQQGKDKLKIRSSSLGMNDLLASNNNNKKKTKIRQLKQLKELRGTIHMPRVEDFLPKKQEIQPALFSRQHSPNKQFKNFRRQKYSRNDVHVQQV